MAASPDENGEDSTETENGADANDDDGGFDVEALLEAQFEAIEEHGEQITELMKAAHFQIGVDNDTSDEVQQAVRALMQEIINEHDEVSTVEVADAMWSELLFISSKLQEDPDEADAENDAESEVDAEDDGNEQAKLDDIAVMGADDDGDSEVTKSGPSHDPAFQ
jgi:hypothetical protein